MHEMSIKIFAMILNADSGFACATGVGLGANADSGLGVDFVAESASVSTAAQPQFVHTIASSTNCVPQWVQYFIFSLLF